MTQHVTKSEVIRLRERKLTPGETLVVVRHLESCSGCAATAAGTVDSQAVAEAWSGTLHASLGEHLRGDELLDYVDGRLSAAIAVDADTHLEHCAECREDVDDLRSLRAGRWHRWPRIAFGAAAALVVGMGLAGLFRHSATKAGPVTPSRPSLSASSTPDPAGAPPAAWQALVDDAVRSGRIGPPAILAALRMPDETVRGHGQGRPSVVSPNDVVLDDPRPSFRWTASPGLVYVVSVFDGDREVARSAPIHAGVWKPASDLARGRVYRWQVVASRGKETWIIPAAPEPAPVFDLLDEVSHRDLDSARRGNADDHLLLGVLAAHYGLQEQAIEELTRHHSTHPDSRSASLLASVRTWREGDRR